MSDILEFIDANTVMLPTRPKGFGITANEYKDAKGVGRNTADRVLEGLAKQGLLLVQKMHDGGRVVNVYYRPKDV